LTGTICITFIIGRFHPQWGCLRKQIEFALKAVEMSHPICLADFFAVWSLSHLLWGRNRKRK